MKKKKLNDLTAEQKCMTECVAAFEGLSRHHCELHDNDSVAVDEAWQARIRVLQWLASYIQEHKYL